MHEKASTKESRGLATYEHPSNYAPTMLLPPASTSNEFLWNPHLLVDPFNIEGPFLVICKPFLCMQILLALVLCISIFVACFWGKESAFSHS